MGNSQTTYPPKESIVIINRENVDTIEKYGYPYFPAKFSVTSIPSHDNELSTCMKNMIVMFDYEINIKQINEKIVDPIVIHDKLKNDIFKLYRIDHDFYHVPDTDKYIRYKLEVNDKHIYKFPHISNVQLYFETMNQKFAKY